MQLLFSQILKEQICILKNYNIQHTMSNSFGRDFFDTWSARVSSSNICCWTLKGSAWISPGSLSSELLVLEDSAGLVSAVRLIFLLGILLLIESWKRIALSWSNWAVTAWSFSLKIKTCRSKNYVQKKWINKRSHFISLSAESTVQEFEYEAISHSTVNIGK